MSNDIKRIMEELAMSINQLDLEDVMEWIEGNITYVTPGYNELKYAIGGPSISIYIDSGAIIGSTDPFNSIMVRCNTRILEEFFDEYREMC